MLDILQKLNSFIHKKDSKNHQQDDISIRFKKLLSGTLKGQAFIDFAMTKLDFALQFGAMAIQIDKLKNKPSNEIMIEAIEAINMVCSSEDAAWGLLGYDVFGCFFANKSEDACIAIGKKIQKELANRCKETINIGIALYPFIQFDKRNVIVNACKALDHATLLGNGSIIILDAISLNISGDQFYQKGDIHNAAKEFEMALLLDPSNANVHNSLGICYGELELFEKAEEEFEKSVMLNPKEIMAIYNIGFVNMLSNNKDKALEYFIKADSIKNTYEIAFQMGRIYCDLKQPEKGIVFFEKALKLKPKSSAALCGLAECYVGADMTDDAVLTYKKAIKQNPNNAAAHSSFGCLLEKLGENLDTAITFCEQSVEISPENGLFRYRLGLLYFKRNKFDNALEEFKDAEKFGYDSTQFIEKIQNMMNKFSSGT